MRPSALTAVRPTRQFRGCLAPLLGLLLVGCAGRAAPPGDQSCRVRLAPRSTTLGRSVLAPTPPARAQTSRLVTQLEIPIQSIVAELESKVPSRLVDERGRSIGIAGHLNYNVERGPFSATVEGESLIVHADVRGHAEACRGSSCYAACDPQGRATATVPLRLLPEYRFAPSRVSVDLTRGCVIRALSGFVKIDVTPTIVGQMQPALRRVGEDIDARLPQLRPQAERLWLTASQSHALPLGGCAVMNPRGIAQGPIARSKTSVHARFALVAFPELRTTPCEDAGKSPKSPLPPLTYDPTITGDGDLLLALVGPLSKTVASLESTATTFDVGNARSFISRTTAVPVAGPLAQIDFALGGEACGDIAIRSPLAWSDKTSLRLTMPYLMPGERERIGAALNPEIITDSLTRMRLEPPLRPDALAEAIPAMVQSMSNESMEAQAHVAEIRPVDVVLRADDVVATVSFRGSVDLRQRSVKGATTGARGSE